MNNALKAYIIEVKELLAELESALLILENNPNDKSCIENVFRVMHTLKGNSSMFGFDVISETVHELETIYDNVRTGKVQLGQRLLNCTLEALDHLRKVVEDPDLAVKSNSVNHERISNEIKKLIESDDLERLEIEMNDLPQDAVTYYVLFQPSVDFFDDGSNPLILIEELVNLGDILSVPHFKSIESFSDMDPVKNYTYWEIYIETSVSKKEIQDVFVFAEFNSEIEIIELFYTGLVKDATFREQVEQFKHEDKRIGSGDLLTIAQSVGIPAIPEVPKTEDNQETVIKSNSISSIRVGSDKLDELMNLVSELITTQAGLTLHANMLGDMKLEEIAENIEKLSRRLRDVSFGMTLIPVNSLFNRFQRMIRDTAKKLDKEISFKSEGGETELDKSIIESLSDPLMHILRNSIDHGIETPAVRTELGKPKKGKLTIKSYYSGVFVYIQVIDDGRGIDTAAIRAKAIEKEIITEGDELDEKQLIDLIFHPGFSTSKDVSDVSGRGVGMDVVRKDIEDMRGTVSVSSVDGKGTKITIKLPLTLSVIDGLLVEIDQDKYVVPLSVVSKCYEVMQEELDNNFNDLLVLDGEQVPFINLRSQFGYSAFEKTFTQIIVINNEDRKVGISVDNIIGEYQAVVKTVGKYYKNQPFVSGATILGDGTIALILDTSKLIEMYRDQKLNEYDNAIN
ncbi:MAG: chemotaxis protein CheA [Ekhidna sp.]